MKPTLKISLDDIRTNWKSLNKASKGKAAAVVKADAYGMGMLRIVEALLEAGCCYFYVANINEALKLREKFNSKQISVAVFEGYFEGNQKIYAENNLIPILNSLEQVKRFKNYLAHVESIKPSDGDIVTISSIRPISKRKRWQVSKILRKAKKIG